MAHVHPADKGRWVVTRKTTVGFVTASVADKDAAHYQKHNSSSKALAI
jgi:hypothetical protein